MRALGASLAIGAILLGWSELAFWAHPRAGDSPVGIAQTWLAYSLVGFWLLVAVKRYGLRTWWAAALLGAGYGWTVEGVLVTTTYESLPLSLAWTALAWHAPLTVLLGLAAAGASLVGGSRVRLAGAATLIGAVAGVWSGAWRAEDGSVGPVLPIAAWWLLTTVIAVGGYLALSRVDAPGWAPSRRSMVVAGALVVGWLALVTAPSFWPAVIASPVLVALALTPLELARRRSAPTSTDEAGPAARPGHTVLPGPVRWADVALVLLLVPSAATVGFAVSAAAGVVAPMWVVYLVLTPGGIALAGAAVWRALRSGRPVVAPAVHPPG